MVEDGAVMDEIVGAVLSMVIVDDAAVADEGPDVVPVTDDAFIRGIKVPSLQDVMEIVKLVPEEDETAKLHPVAVPEFSKSEPSMPDTDSLMVSE